MPEILAFRYFDVTVIRSDRRRSATLRVDQSGVSFRVPKEIGQQKIVELVEKKTAWIRKKLEYEASLTPPVRVGFESGDPIPYLGKSYKLKVQVGDYPQVEMVGQDISVSVVAKHLTNPPYIRSVLERWFLDEAAILLSQRLDFFAPLVGVRPTGIQVKAYKARWGSCKMDGQIQFNWRLIHGPVDVLDYVVVHELCHMLQHNHSAAYWSEVARVMPDYKVRRKWLSENGNSLTI